MNDTTTVPDVTTRYRAALRATCPHHLARAVIDLADRFAPVCQAAAVDLAVLTGQPLPPVARPVSRWERQHLEIVRELDRRDLVRASGLLQEHLSGHGCDPAALAAIGGLADLTQPGVALADLQSFCPAGLPP